MQLLKTQAMNFLCYEDGYKKYYNKGKGSLMNKEFSSHSNAFERWGREDEWEGKGVLESIQYN